MATRLPKPGIRFIKLLGGWGWFFWKVLRWVGRSFWFQLQVVPNSFEQCFLLGPKDTENKDGKDCKNVSERRARCILPLLIPFRPYHETCVLQKNWRAAGGKIHLHCVRTEETVVSHGQGPRNRSLTDNMMQQYVYIYTYINFVNNDM